MPLALRFSFAGDSSGFDGKAHFFEENKLHLRALSQGGRLGCESTLRKLDHG